MRVKIPALISAIANILRIAAGWLLVIPATFLLPPILVMVMGIAVFAYIQILWGFIKKLAASPALKVRFEK
ncbi:MAG: hypothetical protein KGJ01_00545 [Patescibacteria group bacterium]|nr:hypothetical protein [Patescibacteria group bacterium]